MAYQNEPISPACEGVRQDGSWCDETVDIQRIDPGANDDNGVPFYFDLCPACQNMY